MLSRTSTTLLDGLQDPQNDRAWQRFYARYLPMLLSHAKRMGLSDADAQDVAAQTLTTFVTAYWAGGYKRERGRLKSWLGGIIQNKVRKALARRRPVSLDAPSSGERESIWSAMVRMSSSVQMPFSSNRAWMASARRA